MELETQSKGDKILYVIIDINGAKNVNKAKIPANYVAILPPSEETLEKRLKGRGTESEEVIKERSHWPAISQGGPCRRYFHPIPGNRYQVHGC